MMTFCHGNNSDRKWNYRRQEDEALFGKMYRLDSRPVSPSLEQEKRIRREIANSNERRRMQSINAGFQSLRALLPNGECDKLSKAAILQGTVDYVHQLEQEKTCLISQNIQLTRRMRSSNDSDGSCSDSPIPKRKKRKTELLSQLLDEGIGSASPSSQSENEDAKHEVVQLRIQLERERAWRLRLEKELEEKEARQFGPGKTEPVDHDYTEYEDAGKSSETATDLHQETPQSRFCGQELDGSHKFSERESSVTEHSTIEDLSFKNNPSSLPSGDLSMSTVHNTPDPQPTRHVAVTQSSSHELIPQQVNPSKQSLDAILYAISQLEGDHMFQDSVPAKSKLPQSIHQGNVSEQFEQTKEEECSFTDSGLSFQRQIIRNAPVTQNRAGVIVSNLS